MHRQIKQVKLILFKLGYTPLFLAANGSHTAVVNQLAEAGADVNTPNNEGMSPLMYASIEGSIEMVRALLIQKADFKQKNLQGM